jgi:hypothetical protein
MDSLSPQMSPAPWSLRLSGRSHLSPLLWHRRQTCSSAQVDAKRIDPLQMRKWDDGYCSVRVWEAPCDFRYSGSIVNVWQRELEKNYMRRMVGNLGATLSGIQGTPRTHLGRTVLSPDLRVMLTWTPLPWLIQLYHHFAIVSTALQVTSFGIGFGIEPGIYGRQADQRRTCFLHFHAHGLQVLAHPSHHLYRIGSS